MGNSSSSGNGDRNHNEDGSSNGGGSSNEGSSGFGGIAATRRSTMLGSRALSARITGGGSNNNGVDSNSHNNRRNSVGLPHLNLPSSLPSPFRSGGSLGLTRSELDDRCKPSGLYPTCEWEPKQIRRLISNGLLAARLRGNDSRLTKTDRECPICFMYYSESNVSKCCNATLCTECYLQIKPGKDRYCICPFCNNPKMQVSVARGMDAGDVAKREEEEQRVIEATIKSRVSELHGESPGPSSHSGEGANADGTGGTGFGSSLEIYNRRRTFSNASNVSAASGGSGAGPVTPINPTGSSDADNSALLSLAMTPEDRRALESEMRAQLSHQTHRNMEREADEARMRHAQEWYGTQGAARSRMREARLAELNGLLERMTARGGGVAGGRDNNNNNIEDGEGDNSLMAGANEGFRGAAGPRYGGTGSLNRLLRSMEQNSSTRGAGGNSLEDLMRLEAAFFLGMDGDARAHRRGLLGRNPNVDTDLHENNNNDEDDDEEEDDGLGLAGMMPRPSPFGSSRASRRAVRRLGGGSNRGVSSTHLDTAELLMRGVSEEEQLAMAIAMSMQDNPQNQQSENNSEQQQGQAAQAEDGSGDDSSSSGESASSSSDSSEDDDDDVAGGGGGQVEATNNTNNNSQGSGNNSDRRASGGSGNSNVSGAGSLNEDEEQVVFTDMAEV